MSEQTDAIVGAVFLTTIFTTMFWLLVWCVATITRLKGKNDE